MKTRAKLTSQGHLHVLTFLPGEAISKNASQKSLRVLLLPQRKPMAAVSAWTVVAPCKGGVPGNHPATPESDTKKWLLDSPKWLKSDPRATYWPENWLRSDMFRSKSHFWGHLSESLWGRARMSLLSHCWAIWNYLGFRGCWLVPRIAMQGSLKFCNSQERHQRSITVKMPQDPIPTNWKPPVTQMTSRGIASRKCMFTGNSSTCPYFCRFSMEASK